MRQLTSRKPLSVKTYKNHIAIKAELSNNPNNTLLKKVVSLRASQSHKRIDGSNVSFASTSFLSSPRLKFFFYKAALADFSLANVMKATVGVVILLYSSLSLIIISISLSTANPSMNFACFKRPPLFSSSYCISQFLNAKCME